MIRKEMNMTNCSKNLNSVKTMADRFNAGVGNLKGYDCPKCKNKGQIMFHDEDDYDKVRDCECMRIRKVAEHIEDSGLKDVLKKYTFKNYTADKEWQKGALKKACEFVRNNDGAWFLACGQAGSGKTHICTAIAGQLLRQGRQLHYMLWRDEVVRLKANVMDNENYQHDIEKLKNAEVLYIDDFFKVRQGEMPTTAEVNIAFEIINHRYNLPNAVTIISTEKSARELIDIDEAVASRICERCRGTYILQISKSIENNYRLKGVI